MARLVRKPTPDQIAELMIEDEFGNPMMSQTPISPVVSAGPTTPFGRDPPRHNDSMPLQQVMTEMRSCNATSCSNNDQGRCSLRSIGINEHGGCTEYEAAADYQQGDGRYEEQPADNDSVAPYNPDVDLRQTGPWDPRGGGY